MHSRVYEDNTARAASMSDKQHVGPHDMAGNTLRPADVDRFEVVLAFSGKKQQRLALDEDTGEDDALVRADGANTVGSDAGVWAEDDAIAGRSDAAQMFHRAGCDLVGEEPLRLVLADQAAVHEQFIPSRGRRGRLRNRVGSRRDDRDPDDGG